MSGDLRSGLSELHFIGQRRHRGYFFDGDGACVGFLEKWRLLGATGAESAVADQLDSAVPVEGVFQIVFHRGGGADGPGAVEVNGCALRAGGGDVEDGLAVAGMLSEDGFEVF